VTAEEPERQAALRDEVGPPHDVLTQRERPAKPADADERVGNDEEDRPDITGGYGGPAPTAVVAIAVRATM